MIKYTILDETDIALVQEFSFEAKVVIDKNGNGANVYAYAYDISKGKTSCQLVHELLWERRYGGIAFGFKVIHKNGITMDNRLDNLCLVPTEFNGPIVFDNTHGKQRESLYWAAMKELPADHIAEENSSAGVGKLKQIYPFDEPMDDDETTYYECHYLPCTTIEHEPREFSICGRCQEARYCGPSCQQDDWPVHKTFCREKPRYALMERFPER